MELPTAKSTTARCSRIVGHDAILRPDLADVAVALRERGPNAGRAAGLRGSDRGGLGSVARARRLRRPAIRSPTSTACRSSGGSTHASTSARAIPGRTRRMRSRPMRCSASRRHSTSGVTTSSTGSRRAAGSARPRRTSATPIRSPRWTVWSRRCRSPRPAPSWSPPSRRRGRCGGDRLSRGDATPPSRRARAAPRSRGARSGSRRGRAPSPRAGRRFRSRDRCRRARSR